MRHQRIVQGTRRLPPVLPAYIPFEGGYDIVTPAFHVPPGRLREAQNWEIGINEGYNLIEGYERFDGRPKPSNAVYYIIEITLTGSIDVGDTVTGATSGATADVIAVATDSSYIVVTKVSGTFEEGETLNVGGSGQATADTEARSSAATSVQMHWQYKNLAADAYREDIEAVPGTGSILGITMLEGVTYAFRANAGGTEVDIYKSTTGGWTKVALGRELVFTSGGTTEITEGQTITGATSGATAVVTRVMLESGSWAAGDAAGKFIFASQTGTFQAEDIDVGASTNLATIAEDSSEITLDVGGRFVFDYYNFGDGRRIYGADGVNRGFEFDGEVFCPIDTGMTEDAPTHVTAHKNHLFFSFDGSLQHSGIKQPYSWSPITGAAELVIGDTITGFSSEGGSETNGALAVYSKNSIHILYGSSSSDWSLVRYKDEVGAQAYSIQQVVDTYFLDERGVTRLRAAEAFGNFNHSSVSQLIHDWIIQRKTLLNDSCIVRDKNQIRYFFSDKYALYITFRAGRLVGMMPCLFTDTVECIYSLEDSDGTETIKFGSNDGFVYELDAGTSFDGDNINSFIVTHFHHDKSPRINKDYLDMTLEVKGTGFAAMTIGYTYSYGDTSVPQAATQTSQVSFAETQWDHFIWDTFFWDGQTITPNVVEMDGAGENISIAIRTDSDYFPPLKVSGAYYHYRHRQRLRFSI